MWKKFVAGIVLSIIGFFTLVVVVDGARKRQEDQKADADYIFKMIQEVQEPVGEPIGKPEQKPSATPIPVKEKDKGGGGFGNLTRIAALLIQVESDGRNWLIGDNHLKNKAYGPLQVRKPVLEDVNKALGTRYTAEQMNGNRELSVKVWKAYIKLWATQKRLGHQPTTKDIARIWNGGPDGYKKASTQKYWRRTIKIAKEEGHEDLLAKR